LEPILTASNLLALLRFTLWPMRHIVLPWPEMTEITSIRKNIFPYLILWWDAGAHLDIATISGYTVLNCLPTKFSVIIDVTIDAYFSSLKNSVFPLSCYCARVIRWEGIPFDKHRIPCHLQEFVSRHSAQGKLN
jgi:hypothetical protein